MNEAYHKYEYDGPVLAFNTIVTSRWKGETMAISEKKARSNLAYQFKINNGQIAGSKINLPGDIKMIN